MILTRIEIKNLVLVKQGKITRTFSTRGNSIQGAHSRTIKGLEARSLIIEDKPHSNRYNHVMCFLRLTRRGEQALGAHRK